MQMTVPPGEKPAWRAVQKAVKLIEFEIGIAVADMRQAAQGKGLHEVAKD